MAARRSFGRIRKLPSGFYQAGYVGPDGATHYALSTFQVKADAEAWLVDERRLTQSPEWLPPAGRKAAAAALRPPTLAEYAEGWLSSRNLKPTTKQLYRGLLEKHVLPILGGLEMPSITPLVLRRWHTALGPNRPTQRAHAYSLLRTIMGTALGEQIITSQPCVIRGAGVTRRKHTPEPATLEELQAITNAMPAHLRVAVQIAAWCGLRQGELLELRRGDVDLAVGQLRIRRGVVRVTGEPPLVGSTKSAAGERDVSIPPHVMPALVEHLEQHVPPAIDSLLFVGRDSGQQLASSTLYRWYYPAREAAGRPDLRWHDLRHTGATYAALAGATLPELMNRLGHSTVGAAMRYQHVAKGRDAEIARRLSEMVRST